MMCKIESVVYGLNRLKQILYTHVVTVHGYTVFSLLLSVSVGEGRLWADQALCVAMSTDHADYQGHEHSGVKVENETPCR